MYIEERTGKELPLTLVGSFRTFGEQGPAYEIIEMLVGDDKNEAGYAKIRVVHSGEILKYDIQKLISDPPA